MSNKITYIIPEDEGKSTFSLHIDDYKELLFHAVDAPEIFVYEFLRSNCGYYSDEAIETLLNNMRDFIVSSLKDNMSLKKYQEWCKFREGNEQ